MSESPLTSYSPQDLAASLETWRSAYNKLKARGLDLDLTRGTPSAAQLDLSEKLLTLPHGHYDAAGTDVRVYSGPAGLPELRAIFAALLGVDDDQIIAGGNSSLAMMWNSLTYCMLHGAVDSEHPWAREEKVRFVCPVPGYDRHFAMLEWFGIEMLPVPMNDDGPDVDAVAALVESDPSVRGMWVVPTYANPSGSVCSKEVAAALAAMPTAAPDFKIFWDNAYAFHHLTERETESADIVSLADAAGHPHRPMMFASTSKITFAGGGVGFYAGSRDSVRWYLTHFSKSSIGPNQVNQLAHVQFFQNPDGVLAHMAKHRAIIAPKFAEVQRVLAERLGDHGVAHWTNPAGGYFVSLDVLDGTASRVVALAKDLGVALTPAGAPFPYGKDPRDRNIRLAPTMPPLPEVTAAMEAVATCVMLAAAEQRRDHEQQETPNSPPVPSSG
jgi:DNA-binding transcriptional MocR family regulator